MAPSLPPVAVLHHRSTAQSHTHCAIIPKGFRAATRLLSTSPVRLITSYATKVFHNFCFFVCLSVCVLFSVAIWQWAFLLKQLCVCVCVLTCDCTNISRTRRQLTKRAKWTAGQDRTGGGLCAVVFRLSFCRRSLPRIDCVPRKTLARVTTHLHSSSSSVTVLNTKFRPLLLLWESLLLLLLCSYAMNVAFVAAADSFSAGFRTGHWAAAAVGRHFHSSSVSCYCVNRSHTIRQNHSHNCIILNEAPNKIEIKKKVFFFVLLISFDDYLRSWTHSII